VFDLPEVTWSADPATGDKARRTGSKSIALRCGGFSMTVRSGFFNANPNGELGAADDFVVIDFQAGEMRLPVQMSPLWCPEDAPRSASLVPNNAEAIEGRYVAAKRRYELKLEKRTCDAAYSQRRVVKVFELK
jgi:hypothetical protein